MKQWCRAVMALLSLVLACALPHARLEAQGVTTSAVGGRVTTADGGPVAGAQITLTNAATGSVSTVVTRSDGRYFIPGLQPGAYRVGVTGLGYAPQARDNVSLVLGQTASLDFTLATQVLTLEGITVLAEGTGGVMSRSRTGAASVVTDSTLRRAPTITRDLQDFTRLVPQIAITNSTTGAASGGGRNNRFNQLQIDGTASNDLFGLSASGSPSGQAGAKAITLEAIQELQVVLAPFDVRQNGFTGASVNAITRSGTNRFGGSVSAFNRNEDLTGRYVTYQDTASRGLDSFHNTEVAGSLGGPIRRDRAFFFVAGELTRRRDPVLFVADTNATRGVTLAQAQQVATRLQALGYDPGGLGAVDRDRESVNLFGRLDFNLGENSRLTLRHNYIDGFREDFARSSTNYFLGNAGYTQNSTTNSTVAQLNSGFGGGLFNELRLGYNRVRDHRSFDGGEFPRVTVQMASSRNVIAGTENFSGQNILDQDAFEFTNDLTIPWRAHTFTVGTNNEFSRFSNLFVRNPFGNYTFPSYSAFELGRPSQYEYSYLCQPGLPSCTTAGNARAEFPVVRLGIYAQDRWDARENLQLTLGLRFDNWRLPDEPGYNARVDSLYSRSTNAVPGSTLLFNPRFGFNWDVTGDQATQVRGGIGRFSGRTPYVWISNAYGNTGLDYVRFTCSTSGSTPTGTPNFVADPRNQPQSCQPGVAAAATPNEINLINPDFRPPQILRGSLAVDRRLPFGLIGTLEGLWTRTVHDVLYQNLRVSVDAQGRMVEGRPRYQTRASSATPGFGDIIDIRNTSEGSAYNLTAQIQRPFQNGWDFSAAYTNSRSEDVNPLTSSQAISNWRFNVTNSDPNNPGLARSDFDIPHRIVATTSRQLRLLPRFTTDLSLVYVGQSGRPFSVRYNGDINFDGSTGNDLVYVPGTEAEVRFSQETVGGQVVSPSASWQNLNAFIEGIACLREARGRVMDRNECREPWSNRFDFRLAQSFAPFRGQSAQFTVDILNVANLLNRDWGRSEFVSNQTYDLLTLDTRTGVNNAPDAQGRRLYRAFTPRESIYTISNLDSRYQIQLGLRYGF
jgi:outer membrane receptor for ferrienterochelin and colicin